MPTQEGSLITFDEAEQVAKVAVGKRHHMIWMIVTGAGALIALVMLTMIVISLVGAKTGLEALFPFLDKKPDTNLQLPKS